MAEWRGLGWGRGSRGAPSIPTSYGQSSVDKVAYLQGSIINLGISDGNFSHHVITDLPINGGGRRRSMVSRFVRI